MTDKHNNSRALPLLGRLDSTFDLEEFRHGVETQVGPELVRDYMRGDVKKLRGVCGEVAYNKISAEVRNRKKEVRTHEHWTSIRRRAKQV